MLTTFIWPVIPLPDRRHKPFTLQLHSTPSSSMTAPPYRRARLAWSAKKLPPSAIKWPGPLARVSSLATRLAVVSPACLCTSVFRFLDNYSLGARFHAWPKSIEQLCEFICCFQYSREQCQVWLQLSACYLMCNDHTADARVSRLWCVCVCVCVCLFVYTLISVTPMVSYVDNILMLMHCRCSNGLRARAHTHTRARAH